MAESPSQDTLMGSIGQNLFANSAAATEFPVNFPIPFWNYFSTAVNASSRIRMASSTSAFVIFSGGEVRRTLL